MNIISNVMFWISNGLLVPVLVGLIYLFVKSLFILGGLYGTWQNYRRRYDLFNPILSCQQSFDREQLLKSAPSKGMFGNTLAELLQADQAYRNFLISQYEIKIERKLGSAKILSKFGPILGLMGTLIPMGPALVGLSTGDISSMAYNMQVAFATTVIGMFVSAVGYISLHILRMYNRNDLIWLDYINEKLS